jgi:hypothetical protein
LAVFIILALVRLEGLKDYEKECNYGFKKNNQTIFSKCDFLCIYSGYLKEKALPSAGPVRFYQNLICTSMNWCYNDYQNNTILFNEALEFER